VFDLLWQGREQDIGHLTLVNLMVAKRDTAYFQVSAS